MNQRYSITLLLLLAIAGKVCSQDLPGPPSNIQSLPANSYIIAMDSTNQKASNGFFNLKTYGLVVYLLNKGVKVKWIITAGKIKDAADFTVLSEQIKPTLNAIPISRSFRAGPFVIFASDTTGVAAYVNQFYTTWSLTGSDRPNIYINTVAVNVDVRYNLTGFVPHAAILNDGGNDTIHTNYMIRAAISPANYNTSTGKDLDLSCYTFASEPHNTSVGPNTDTAIMNIKKFVQLGGNFLAQCAAVTNYENSSYGRFQTTTGITTANTFTGSGINYSNPDLSYSQYEGPFVVYDGASVVQNWTINASGANNEHTHCTGSSTYSANISASVSKLKTGTGGLVFYMGVHTFNTMLVQQTINGVRMYMNAFLTPAVSVCGLNPLPVSLLNLTGYLQNGHSRLQWTVAENETGSHFEIEKSDDGSKFSAIGSITNTFKPGQELYNYIDAATYAGIVYYRLKMVNKDNSFNYSRIVKITTASERLNEGISMIVNPVTFNLQFMYHAQTADNLHLYLYNNLGMQTFASQLNTNAGDNSYVVNLPSNLPAGIYYLELKSSATITRTKIIKQ